MSMCSSLSEVQNTPLNKLSSSLEMSVPISWSAFTFKFKLFVGGGGVKAHYVGLHQDKIYERSLWKVDTTFKNLVTFGVRKL